MIRYLRKLTKSPLLLRFPRIKKLISLMVDFQVETFEIFNTFVFLSWGLWGIMASHQFNSPVFNNPYIPASLWAYTGFLIGVFCFISLVCILDSKSKSLKFRKLAMLVSAMFWSFTVTMFIIYNLFSPALPVYHSLMIFCLWVSLRLTSYEHDLKHSEEHKCQ